MLSYETQYKRLILLTSFKFKSILIRVSIISIVTPIILWFSIKISDHHLLGFHKEIFYTTLITAAITLSETNTLLSQIFRRREILKHNVSIQILIHLIFSSLIIITTLIVSKTLLNRDNILGDPLTQLILLFTIGIVIIMILILITARLAGDQVNTLNEINTLKQEQLQSSYNTLQDQLNPHFLFNNLSVLKSMIQYSPKEEAVNFTQNFTDVYRYVLKSVKSTTVSLGDELEFIEAYIGLHKERLGDGLIVDIDISEELLTKTLPPLSLQLLVENAIKHNIASRLSPLHIEISGDFDKVTVSNSVNIKETTYSTKTGLTNLRNRYKILTSTDIIIVNNSSIFAVTIPII